MKKFIVEVTGYNAWSGSKTTDELEFVAKNADDAKKQARAQMRNNGWTKQDGALSYRARVA